MALAQNIDGVPAYTTIAEALAWGNQFGVTSYHTHLVSGQVVYMAGSNHDEVTSAARAGNPPVKNINYVR